MKFTEDEKYFIKETLDDLKSFNKAMDILFENDSFSLCNAINVLREKLDETFYNFIEEYKIDIFEMVKKLNETSARFYEVRFGKIAVEFKDCYYCIVDKNCINYLYDYCGVDYEKT